MKTKSSMTMKRKAFIALAICAASLSCLMAASCGSDNESVPEVQVISQDGVTDSKGVEDEEWPDVWSTPCKNNTMGTRGGKRFASMKLTKGNDIIAGIIVDREWYCGDSNFIVNSTMKGDTLEILQTEQHLGEGFDGLDCICRYDIYFTIREALKNKYYLLFSINIPQNVVYEGWISFEDYPEIIIEPGSINW